MATDAAAQQPDAAKPAGFEDLVGELDRLVTQLESGQLSLEDSLQAFERGMVLAKQAAAILDAAEARIEQLSGTADKPVRKPLDEA